MHETLYHDGEIFGQKITDQVVLLHHFPDPNKSRGDYLPLLKMRAEENPDDYYGLVYLAHELFYRGYPQECLDFIDTQVLPRIPLQDMMYCETDLYMFRGDCLVELKRNLEAEQSYKYGIAITPAFRDNYLQLAKLYQLIGRWQDSIDIINQAFANSRRLYSWLERDDAWTFGPADLLCMGYYRIGAKHTALMYAKLAYALNPTDKRLKYNVQAISSELKIE